MSSSMATSLVRSNVTLFSKGFRRVFFDEIQQLVSSNVTLFSKGFRLEHGVVGHGEDVQT